MRMAVLGTGVVGRTIAGALAELGHEVSVGTRDPGAAMARPASERERESFADWHRRNDGVRVAAFSDAAMAADMVFNCTSGHASVAALESVGEENLAGTVVADLANPLDFSTGELRLFVSNGDSLAERIQSRFPAALVVKTLNIVNAAVMVDPASVGDGDHTMFLAGNDADAKRRVEKLLRDGFGWRHVVDLGDLSGARGMEMYLPLWLRMMRMLGSPSFNIRVVT